MCGGVAQLLEQQPSSQGGCIGAAWLRGGVRTHKKKWVQAARGAAYAAAQVCGMHSCKPEAEGHGGSKHIRPQATASSHLDSGVCRRQGAQ